MELDVEFFDFLFHHIFFPPKLPQQVEPSLQKLEHRLVKVVRDVLPAFIAAIPPGCRPGWTVALNALNSWIDIVIDDENVCKDTLYDKLSVIGPQCELNLSPIHELAVNPIRCRCMSCQGPELWMDGHVRRVSKRRCRRCFRAFC